jgi:cytosine/adenosine deaminase-related metal-dependent hydrolase
MSDRVLLRDAVLVTMRAPGEVLRGDLLIEGGKIAALGHVEPSRAAGARVIDLNGQVVLPGFIQTHIHLCQTLMRNMADDMVLMDWLRTRIWPYEAALNAEELATSAKIGVAELLLGGTTTILDMGTVHHTDAIGQVLSDSGMRAIFGKCMMNLGDEVPRAMFERHEDSMRESLRLCDAWSGAADGRLGYAFCPRFAVSCTEALLREVGEASRDLGVFIHTHASETTFENEFTQERFGKSNMAFLEDIGLTGPRSVFAHGVHVCDDDCRLLARTQTAIAHCPSSNLKLASGIADLPRYDRHGVKVSLGADGAPCNNNLDAFIELRLAALLQKPAHGPTAMPAERSLRLATLDGAVALGMDHVTGSLDVGKHADLQVLSLDDDPGCGPGGSVFSRIVYSAQRHNIRHVFVQGRHLVDRGELVGWDLGALMAQGRGALAAVTSRMNA